MRSRLDDLRLGRDYSLDDVWKMILLLQAGLDTGNWNEDVKAFAKREIEALTEIHDSATTLGKALA